VVYIQVELILVISQSMNPLEEILRGHFDEGGPGSIFNMMRGGRSNLNERSKMKPLQFALEVTLDEVYKGTTKKMRLTRMRVCKTCKG